MGWLERTQYPRLERDPAPDSLARFSPTAHELAFVETLSGEPSYRLSAMLLLKTFQQLRYFPHLEDIPDAIVRHVRAAMHLDPRVGFGYRQLATPSRHRTAIRAYLEVHECDETGRHAAAAAMRNVEHANADLTTLINAGVKALLAAGVELPAFSTLARISREVRAERNKRVTQLGFGRRVLAAMMSAVPGAAADGDPEEIARQALVQIEEKMQELEQTRGRLRSLLNSPNRNIEHIDVLDALCNEQQPPRK
jgi:hypothetical protein